MLFDNPENRTPAEFRTMREAAGISHEDLSHILNTNLEEIASWDLHVIAPKDAWEILDHQTHWISDTIRLALAGLEETAQKDSDKIEAIELSICASETSSAHAGIDIPNAWHRACVGALAQALTAAGYKYNITYMPEEN